MTDVAKLIGRANRWLRRHVDEADTEIVSNLAVALASQREEIAKLRQDAERYRWLRTAGPGTLSILDMRRESWEWDAAIDAALSDQGGAGWKE
jgi:hypothetical protein